MRKESDNIELRSEEIQDILTRPPHLIVRVGISVICSVILLLFAGCFFFKYPDIIEGEVLITTENPPVWTVAKSTGRIKELLCEDKQLVCEGDLLAVIDNSASTSDMRLLCSLLPKVQITDSIYNIPEELLMLSYELGEVQSYFSTFIRSVINYNNFLSLNLIEQERVALERQLSDRKQYIENLRKQIELKKKELTVAKATFEREELLYNKAVISKLDFETAEQSYLTQQQSMQQLQTSLSLANLETSQLLESLNKFSIQYFQEKNQLLAELKAAHRELLSSTENWGQRYFLTASQTGILTFNTFWKKNQFVNAGDKVFAIVPDDSGLLIGKIKIPSSGSGKVQLGQTVNIKLSGYPYMEYGILQAKIKNISLVSNDDYYVAEVLLGKTLRSSINKELQFTGELIGTAEVITENRNLIDRIVSPIKYLITKYL